MNEDSCCSFSLFSFKISGSISLCLQGNSIRWGPSGTHLKFSKVWVAACWAMRVSHHPAESWGAGRSGQQMLGRVSQHLDLCWMMLRDQGKQGQLWMSIVMKQGQVDSGADRTSRAGDIRGKNSEHWKGERMQSPRRNTVHLNLASRLRNILKVLLEHVALSPVSLETPIFLSFKKIFFYSFIHMCIHCLGHFSTLPPSYILSPPPPLSSRLGLWGIFHIQIITFYPWHQKAHS
jgi:hypothetical protein